MNGLGKLGGGLAVRAGESEALAKVRGRRTLRERTAAGNGGERCRTLEPRGLQPPAPASRLHPRGEEGQRTLPQTPQFPVEGPAQSTQASEGGGPFSLHPLLEEWGLSYFLGSWGCKRRWQERKPPAKVTLLGPCWSGVELKPSPPGSGSWRVPLGAVGFRSSESGLGIPQF